MNELQGKVALVTGGASGLGKAIAELFLKEGAKVVISDVNAEAGKKEADAMGGGTLFVKADSSSPAENNVLVSEALNRFGRMDIAVNNAGIGGAQKPTGEYGIDEWKQVIDINLSGVFYGMRYQIPAMLKTGGGCIINMASILGQVGFANSAAYTAAKHGVVGLTQTAAWEYGTQGIRVNAVAPGFIETPLLKDMDKGTIKFLEGLHAPQRLGRPVEVAALVLWLASDKASFVTGGYYPVDGGYLAK